MREAGRACTGGAAATTLPPCTPHRGHSWSHHRRPRATRRGRNAKATLPIGGGCRTTWPRAQVLYKAGVPESLTPMGPGPPARSAPHPRPSVCAATVPEQRALGSEEATRKDWSLPAKPQPFFSSPEEVRLL
jgi:hypothetical protein